MDLRKCLMGRVCVLGIGNRDRGDDGAGSCVAERLAKRTNGMVLDAGAVPENYLERAVRMLPDTILLVDAVDFGGSPGEIRVLDPGQTMPSGLSTHALSMNMTAEFLEARSPARVLLLAVQPESLGWKSRMSVAVEQAVAEMVEALAALLPPPAEKAEERTPP